MNREERGINQSYASGKVVEKDSLFLGIDFGTTNSTVCIFDGKRYYFVKLEATNEIIPSLLYIDRTYSPEYGETARSKFIEDNRHRKIEIEKFDLGYIEITLSESFLRTPFSSAPTTFDTKISGYTDKNLPGFLFGSMKRLLGNHFFISVKIFEKNYKIEAVISSIIQNIKKKLDQQYTFQTFSSVFVGIPVNYESAQDNQVDSNNLAIDRMKKALQFANIENYQFFLEPVAPVLSYLYDTEDESANILVLDFGGGTLDFSLINREENQLNVINNAGFPFGGDVINEIIFRKYILDELGLSEDNVKILERNNVYVDELIQGVIHWRMSYLLNQPKYLDIVFNAIKILPKDSEKLNRLRLLIIKHYSYQIFLSIENAKKSLSQKMVVTMEFAEIGFSIMLTRKMLEEAISSYLNKIRKSINGFLQSNQYTPQLIDRVILTGGTSLIPAIKSTVSSMFDQKVVNIDPFLCVVKGFALGAWLYSQNRIVFDDYKMHIYL